MNSRHRHQRPGMTSFRVKSHLDTWFRDNLPGFTGTRSYMNLPHWEDHVPLKDLEPMAIWTNTRATMKWLEMRTREYLDETQLRDRVNTVLTLNKRLQALHDHILQAAEKEQVNDDGTLERLYRLSSKNLTLAREASKVPIIGNPHDPPMWVTTIDDIPFGLWYIFSRAEFRRITTTMEVTGGGRTRGGTRSRGSSRSIPDNTVQRRTPTQPGAQSRIPPLTQPSVQRRTPTQSGASSTQPGATTNIDRSHAPPLIPASRPQKRRRVVIQEDTTSGPTTSSSIPTTNRPTLPSIPTALTTIPTTTTNNTSSTNTSSSNTSSSNQRAVQPSNTAHNVSTLRNNLSAVCPQ